MSLNMLPKVNQFRHSKVHINNTLRRKRRYRRASQSGSLLAVLVCVTGTNETLGLVSVSVNSRVTHLSRPCAQPEQVTQSITHDGIFHDIAKDIIIFTQRSALFSLARCMVADTIELCWIQAIFPSRSIYNIWHTTLQRQTRERRLLY